MQARLSLPFTVDDATFPPTLASDTRELRRVSGFGTHLAQVCAMAGKSLADRVAALEEKVGDKSIEAQFREQAELIDRRFDHEFRQQAELIDKLFAYRFEELDKKWSPRFANMERDIATVREGISILLKRRPQ